MLRDLVGFLFNISPHWRLCKYSFLLFSFVHWANFILLRSATWNTFDVWRPQKLFFLNNLFCYSFPEDGSTFKIFVLLFLKRFLVINFLTFFNNRFLCFKPIFTLNSLRKNLKLKPLFTNVKQLWPAIIYCFVV